MAAPDPHAGGVWRLARGRAIRLDRSRIVAILNVTPDSFSDGGALPDAAAVARRAREAVDEGADALDFGAESTRPGAARVPAEAQIARAIPAIRAALGAGVEAPISIDTTLAGVARAAFEAGADAVNDQSAGRDDDGMLALIAVAGMGAVLMHRPRPAGEDRYSHQHATEPDYSPVGGLVAGVREFLWARAEAAMRAGAPREAIAVDPGLGFGKSVRQNLEALMAMRACAPDGFPVMCGASRKSFLGAASNEPVPARRVAESVAAAVIARFSGATLFRVHDVAAHRAALAVADAALRGDGAASERREA